MLGTVALVAIGPVVVLVTPVEAGPGTLLASLALSGSLIAARSLPRVLAPRVGRTFAVLATSVLLGLFGAGLGALEGCSFGAAACRQSIGIWTLLWMSLPILLLLFAGLWRLTFLVPSRVLRVLRRVLGRILR